MAKRTISELQFNYSSLRVIGFCYLTAADVMEHGIEEHQQCIHGCYVVKALYVVTASLNCIQL